MGMYYQKFNGKIDRRSNKNEGEPSSPFMRENFISRDGTCRAPLGTTRVLSSVMSGIPTWGGRYFTTEIGAKSPKTFFYTQDGNMWVIDELAGTATSCNDLLALNAYPEHCFFKVVNQNVMYLVDGSQLWKYDGNNDNNWAVVSVLDTDGNTINPIDVIEHKDRLILMTSTQIAISKNLEPDIFDDANDSIAIIVGSGKGQNLAMGKLEDKLYIFNTEGIFVLYGDVISAQAATFEVRLLEEKFIASRGSLCRVERALLYLASDYNVWSFDGVSSTKLTHSEKLEDFVNTNQVSLAKARATYYNNYYMLSFVETGYTYNNLELWWDAFENKCEFVRGRNVSCYMQTDPTIEGKYMLLGRSDINMIMWADRGYNFDGSAIVQRLMGRFYTPSKFKNVRFKAFYPEIESSSTPLASNLPQIQYLLDTRLGTSGAWTQDTQGETVTLGLIKIGNQYNFTDRIRPKINYSKGQSVGFYITFSVVDYRIDIIGMGIEWIDKFEKKSKKIGA